jgi:hypothetical protein
MAVVQEELSQEGFWHDPKEFRKRIEAESRKSFSADFLESYPLCLWREKPQDAVLGSFLRHLKEARILTASDPECEALAWFDNLPGAKFLVKHFGQNGSQGTIVFGHIRKKGRILNARWRRDVFLKGSKNEWIALLDGSDCHPKRLLLPHCEKSDITGSAEDMQRIRIRTLGLIGANIDTN